ncbi:MAG: DUF4150 domain-containing protein [Sandaracinaceae bacterium]
MAEMVAGRECSTNVIVSTGPDVCLTPVGGSMVPVPYSSVAFLGESERLSSTVLDNGHPDFNLNSRTCTSTGHEAGTGAGIVVPGYQGQAFVQNASPTVFTDGWAGTRHRDPAFINRPDGGATEPWMPRTHYYEMVRERIEGRGGEDSWEHMASEIEEYLESRELEPGTNESAETANGGAMLVVDAEAEPEENPWARREGESGEEYLARLQEAATGRPEDPVQHVQDLQDMWDAMQADPDYQAWMQNIDADVYHDPLSMPGIELNEVASSPYTGHRTLEQAVQVARPVPFSFAGADGNIYSGDNSSYAASQAPYNGLAMRDLLSQEYLRWREQYGEPVEDGPYPYTASPPNNGRAVTIGRLLRGDRDVNPNPGIPLPWNM